MNLSIIIPVYNCEKFLAQCLDSIISEIDNCVEIILIDDGSTDNSNMVYGKYRNVRNLRIFKNKNHGVSYSRNFGIKKAVGEYIMFVDSDDVLIKGWYNNIKDIVKGNKYDIYYISKNLHINNLKKEDLIRKIIGVDIESNYSSVWSKLYKRNIINDFDIKFNEKIINGEDLLFNLEFISNSYNFGFSSRSIYKYRINYQSATHSFNDLFFLSNITFLEQLELILKSANICKESIDDYINFSAFNSIYIALYRISLLSNKKERLKRLCFLNNEYYENLNMKSEYIKNMNILKKLIIKLAINNYYNLSLFIIKIISRIRKENKNILMEEI